MATARTATGVRAAALFVALGHLQGCKECSMCVLCPAVLFLPLLCPSNRFCATSCDIRRCDWVHCVQASAPTCVRARQVLPQHTCTSTCQYPTCSGSTCLPMHASLCARRSCTCWPPPLPWRGLTALWTHWQQRCRQPLQSESGCKLCSHAVVFMAVLVC